MKICFIIHNVYGVGGTNRAVLNLAGALARRHRVEIASVFRRVDSPMFGIPAGVKVVPLVDLRAGSADTSHPLRRRPSTLVPAEEEFARQYSALTDQRIADYLRRARADVVIGTRPGINLCVGHLASGSCVRIAQEHMTLDVVPDVVRAAMRVAYHGIDVSVALTHADAAAFRAELPLPHLRVTAIPDSSPAPRLTVDDWSRPLIVAAGRLDEIKRYDLLLEAFAQVVAERPEWRLRIYGAGPLDEALRSQILELRLHNHVIAMGRVGGMEPEFVKASIGVSTSDRESFGMTIVEAMRCGLPMVSTACPVGPPEIIRDGESGFLVPIRDPDAIAQALLVLIDDPELRQKMGRAASEQTARFDPDEVARSYEQLIDECRHGKGLGGKAAWSQRLPGPLWAGAKAPMLRLVRQTRQVAAVAWPRRLPGGKAAPVADTVVQPDGSVHVRVSWPPGLTHAAALVLRRREADQDEAPVRITLRPSDAGEAQPEYTAEVPSDPPLPEGRWNAYLSAGRHHQLRVRPGLLDGRSLLTSRLPSSIPANQPVVRYIPYETADGFLCIRSWVRATHAEVTSIDYDGDAMVLRGRLFGAEFGNVTPRLVGILRGSGQISFAQDGSSEDGSDFTFRLPAPQLARCRRSRHDEFDLAVAGPDSAHIPLGRLLDDVVDRRAAYRLPAIRIVDGTPLEMVEESPEPTVIVRPHFTIDSGLAVTVVDR